MEAAVADSGGPACGGAGDGFFLYAQGGPVRGPDHLRQAHDGLRLGLTDENSAGAAGAAGLEVHSGLSARLPRGERRVGGRGVADDHV